MLGPNGAGKSSLLQILAGILPVDIGEVLFNDKALSTIATPYLGKIRCLLEQHYNHSFNLSVKEMLAFHRNDNLAADVIPDCLEQALNIQSLMNTPFDQLSGGQQQRVHIARSLLQVWPAIQGGNAIVLLDEPVQSLDIRHQHKVLSLFTNIAEQGNVVILSHHDVNLCRGYASHLCFMKNSSVVNTGSIDAILNVTNMSRLFECQFLSITDERNKSYYFVQ